MGATTRNSVSRVTASTAEWQRKKAAREPCTRHNCRFDCGTEAGGSPSSTAPFARRKASADHYRPGARREAEVSLKKSVQVWEPVVESSEDEAESLKTAATSSSASTKASKAKKVIQTTTEECPAGHVLVGRYADLASICATCTVELSRGCELWSCRECDFDVCHSCLDASEKSKRHSKQSEEEQSEKKEPSLEVQPEDEMAAWPEVEAKAAEDDAKEICGVTPSRASTASTEEPSQSSQEAESDPMSEHWCDTASAMGMQAGSFDPSAAPGPLMFYSWPMDAATAVPDVLPMPLVQTWIQLPMGMLPPAAAPAAEWDGPPLLDVPWDNMMPIPMEGFIPGSFDSVFPMPMEWGTSASSASGDLAIGQELNAALVAEECSASEAVKVAGDETLEGPDGHMYEVFYPECCSPENLLAEVETTVPDSHETSPRNLSTSSSDAASFAEEGASSSQQVLSMPEECACVQNKTSAEKWIEDIMQFMCNLSYDRYPARVRLFEIVQGAVTTALGEHFERLALVGSTALRIDTPDSDLDAVAFTRCIPGEDGDASTPPPMPAEALHWIAELLVMFDGTLNLQLVDCTRVPVLTVSTCDGQLSLDLTIDQQLSESHVLWYQSQQAEPWRAPAPLHSVPAPLTLGWEQGLDAAALRCVKWWLRRRRLPVGKEGGYPTFVWTLMVIYVLRCSLLVKEGSSSCPTCGCTSEKVHGNADPRTLLAAIAAFFDRFADSGLRGRLVFANGSAVFQDCAQAEIGLSEFSVLDPTTTDEISIASGASPVELAPQISMATQLLYAYELQRAQYLSAAALSSEVSAAYGQPESEALRCLFSDVDEFQNTLPAALHENVLIGVFVLYGGELHLGIMQEVHLKPGWTAPFLHRSDDRSDLLAQLCSVDVHTGIVTPVPLDEGSAFWFHPCDIVCQAYLVEVACHDESYSSLRLADESMERWFEMSALLGFNLRPQMHMETNPGGSRSGNKGKKKSSKKTKRVDR
mmetsp:Transcript_13451/g.31629  ORF Transcript_13451/g.31629 Transcript_13451/m.31629 type:complete len:984 (-) Transcript_13451:82-3033(-)